MLPIHLLLAVSFPRTLPPLNKYTLCTSFFLIPICASIFLALQPHPSSPRLHTLLYSLISHSAKVLISLRASTSLANRNIWDTFSQCILSRQRREGGCRENNRRKRLKKGRTKERRAGGIWKWWQFGSLYSI